MSGSCREALLGVRDWSGVPPDVQEYSTVTPGCLGVVGRPSRVSTIGLKTLPDDREW